MAPGLGRIAPGRSGRWNLASDLLLVGLALTGSMVMTGGSASGVVLYLRIAVAATVWLLTAAALHHYDPWSHERGTTDDAMMVTVLCAAVSTSLFVLNKFGSGVIPVPRAVQTFSLLWPAA